MPKQCVNQPHQNHITLLELLLIITIITLLLAILIPAVYQAKRTTQYKVAEFDIRQIIRAIRGFELDHDDRQPERAWSDDENDEDEDKELFSPPPRDPWSHRYVYNPFQVTPPEARRTLEARQYLNTKYDLFSLGIDGESAPSIILPVSYDDVIMADDGGYVGKAKDY